MRTYKKVEFAPRYTEWVYPEDTERYAGIGICLVSINVPEANGYVRTTRGVNKVLLHRHVYCKVNGTFPSQIADNVIMHKCDNRACINPEHLVLGTQSQNILDAYERGRVTVNITSILTEDDVRNIRRMYHSQKITQKELGKMFGVSKNTVKDLINFLTWKHVK